MREIKHLSVHQWLRSAIPDSQQPTSPIGFLFLKLPPPPCAVLLAVVPTVSPIGPTQEQGNHNLFKILGKNPNHRLKPACGSFHGFSLFFYSEGKVHGDSFYDWLQGARIWPPALDFPHPCTPPCIDPALKLGAVESKDSDNPFVEAPKISNSEYTDPRIYGVTYPHHQNWWKLILIIWLS